MSTTTSTRPSFSAEELEEFKTIINKEIEVTKETISHLKELIKPGNGIQEVYRPYDDREEEIEAKIQNLITIKKSELKLKNLHSALERIKDKTYGICQATGRLIDKRRLKMSPEILLSVEAVIQREKK